MTEEPEISLPADEPRHCPNCGIRVAAQASTCLMCGVPLEEEEVETEDEPRRRIPDWIVTTIVVILSLAILAAGGFGLYTMLAVEAKPEEVTPTTTPSPTHTPTHTATPTQTPEPTSTPTAIPPRAHEVQEGETLSDIAELYDITVDQILALNPSVDPELIQPEQVLLVPAATPMPGATNVEEAELSTTSQPSGFVVHVVETGETLISIAEQYDVSVSLIRAANDLSPDEETIRAGQSLIVPLGTPTPSPTPTVDPNATPTPVPAYPAPPLLLPPDGAVYRGGDEPILLQWASVSVLADDEWYELNLSQPPGGVVSDTIRTRATAWRVPLDWLQGANAAVREFRWRVQVVREAGERAGETVYEAAGSSSEMRTFTWLGPTPTPSPSAP